MIIEEYTITEGVGAGSRVCIHDDAYAALTDIQRDAKRAEDMARYNEVVQRARLDAARHIVRQLTPSERLELMEAAREHNDTRIRELIQKYYTTEGAHK